MYVSRPSGEAVAGVVVIHDALGMSQDLRNQADWLASEGYLTAAPDLFHGRGGVACMVSVMRERHTTGESGTRTSKPAPSASLAAHEDSRVRWAWSAFCMGGKFALMSGTDQRLRRVECQLRDCPEKACTTGFLRKNHPGIVSQLR